MSGIARIPRPMLSQLDALENLEERKEEAQNQGQLQKQKDRLKQMNRCDSSSDIDLTGEDMNEGLNLQCDYFTRFNKFKRQNNIKHVQIQNTKSESGSDR